MAAEKAEAQAIAESSRRDGKIPAKAGTGNRLFRRG